MTFIWTLSNVDRYKEAQTPLLVPLLGPDQKKEYQSCTQTNSCTMRVSQGVLLPLPQRKSTQNVVCAPRHRSMQLCHFNWIKYTIVTIYIEIRVREGRWLHNPKPIRFHSKGQCSSSGALRRQSSRGKSITVPNTFSRFDHCETPDCLAEARSGRITVHAYVPYTSVPNGTWALRY